MKSFNHSDSQPYFPDIHLALVGEDGNAFSIIGRARAAMRSAGIPDEQIYAFQAEAMSGDYDALLRTCMRWFSCD